jgi:hypothetical protein
VILTHGVPPAAAGQRGNMMITSAARPGIPRAEHADPRQARRASRAPRARRHAVRGLCGFATVACSVVLASACGSPGQGPSMAAATNPKPAAMAKSSHSAGQPNPSGGASAHRTPPTAPAAPAPPVAILTAIRVAAHGAYDQAVFQFANGIPGYSAGYLAAVSQDAKGTPVPLPGRSFLRVAFHPATTTAYADPGTISPYLPTLLQISPAGNFEGYLSFGLGLSGHGGYRVYTLTHPSRVVIEFPHVTPPKFPGIWDITSWQQFWQSQTAFENGHQPWLASPALVVRAWASSFSSQPTIQQTGPDTFQVTDPVRARMAIVTGTRPVTTGQAQLWVITSILPVPS